MVRIRPLNSREKEDGSKSCVTIEDNRKVIIEYPPDSKSFNFDYVGGQELGQDQIFKIVGSPLS